MRLLTTTLILVLLSVLLLQAGPTAQSQGLQWGFQQGDRYDFQFDTWILRPHGRIEHIQTQFYALAPAPPAIPDPVSAKDGNIPVVSFQQYFSNGATIQNPGIDIGASTAIDISAVPIGNWKLLTVTANEIYLNLSAYVSTHSVNVNVQYNISDTSESWAYSSMWCYGNITSFYWYTISNFTFSKTDGVLLNFSSQYFSEEMNQQNETMTRTGMTPATQEFPMTAVAAGVLVIVVVAVAYEKKWTTRRSPSSS